MELHFTRSSLLNTTLRDAQGVPLFKITSDSALHLSDRTTTVSRFLDTPSSHSPEDTHVDEKFDTESLLQGLQEQVVGQIVWHRLKKPTIKFNGKDEVPIDDYMPLSKTYAKSVTPPSIIWMIFV